MKNKLILVLLALVSFTVTIYAQEDDAKKTALNIKKSSEYLYGEAAGDDTEDVLYNMAHEKLVERIKQYVSSQPDLAAADGVLIDRVRQKTRKIKYTRGIETQVLCLYVKKDEILPLIKNAKETNYVVENNKVKEPEIAEVPVTKETGVTNLQKRQEAPVEIENKRQETPVAVENKRQEVQEDMKMNVTSNNITTEEANADDDEAELSEDEIAQIMTELSASEYKTFEDLVTYGEDDQYIAKKVMILAIICKLNKYEDIKRFLVKRQVNDGGFMYKLTTSFNQEGCFWAIFNGRQELVALLSPELNYDLITQKEVDGRKKYARGAKLWIRFL